jgi:hypothetical protein
VSGFSYDLSVYLLRLATGWTAEGSEFQFWQGQDFSCIHVVQTGSGAHAALLSNGYRGLFPRRQSGRGVKLTIHLHFFFLFAIRDLPHSEYISFCPRGRSARRQMTYAYTPEQNSFTTHATHVWWRSCRSHQAFEINFNKSLQSTSQRTDRQKAIALLPVIMLLFLPGTDTLKPFGTVKPRGGEHKVNSPGMWHRLVWYMSMFRRDLLPPSLQSLRPRHSSTS